MLKPKRFRVARPTDQLAAVKKFYVDALGLQVVGSFEDHDGYDGLILGSGQAGYEIEFTSHADGSPCPSPTADNLLVFYLANADELSAVGARMAAHGHDPVEPENPYWARCSLSFEDPDGWRVTVVDQTQIGSGG